MKGINFGRWLAGGITAGIVIWILEGAASMFYLADMEAAMAAHNLSIEPDDPGAIATTVIVSLLVGLTMIFFYAGIRPRFGPGPKTAVIVAVAYWIGGYFVSLLGYQIMGLFPTGMLVTWGILGLVEMILAALAGAWMYREYAPGED